MCMHILFCVSIRGLGWGWGTSTPSHKEKRPGKCTHCVFVRTSSYATAESSAIQTVLLCSLIAISIQVMNMMKKYLKSADYHATIPSM